MRIVASATVADETSGWVPPGPEQQAAGGGVSGAMAHGGLWQGQCTPCSILGVFQAVLGWCVHVQCLSHKAAL